MFPCPLFFLQSYYFSGSPYVVSSLTVRHATPWKCVSLCFWLHHIYPVVLLFLCLTLCCLQSDCTVCDHWNLCVLCLVFTLLFLQSCDFPVSASAVVLLFLCPTLCCLQSDCRALCDHWDLCVSLCLCLRGDIHLGDHIHKGNRPRRPSLLYRFVKKKEMI